MTALFGERERLIFSNEIDEDGDLEISVEDKYGVTIGHGWLNKEEAERLIKHLQKVFWEQSK